MGFKIIYLGLILIWAEWVLVYLTERSLDLKTSSLWKVHVLVNVFILQFLAIEFSEFVLKQTKKRI